MSRKRKYNIHLLVAAHAIALSSYLYPVAALYAQEPPQEGPVGGQEMVGEEGTTVGGLDPKDPSDLAEITLKNADISTIVRIFSKRTKRNFILDEKVRGTVTVYLPGEIPRETEMKILDSILALKGFTTVPISANLWKVIPAKDARKATVPIRQSNDNSPTTGSVVTTLVQLTYVAANEVQPLINQMISPEGMVQVYSANNSLVLVDYDVNIQRLIELIRTLDIPSADREMTIIPVMHAEAADLAEKLQLVLNDSADSSGQGGSSRNPLQARIPNGNPNIPGMPNQNDGSGGDSHQRREPKLIADERTNSIIIVADLETTARIRALATELDSEINRAGSKFYVYRCQHASAASLSEVLSGSVTGGGATGGTKRTGGGGLGGGGLGGGGLGGGGLGGGGLGGGNGGGGQFGGGSQDRLSQLRRNPGSSRQGNGQAGSAGTVQLDENTSITADPATNSLVIFASEAAYQKVLTLLRELDIKRRQVLVEAVILEVSVDESTQIGTDWLSSGGGADGGVFAQSNFGGAQGLQGLLSNPSQLANFSVAAASAGSLQLPGGTSIPSQTVILNAAKNNSKVNVLSSPTLLSTDNEEAQIVVGQNVPFLASTSTNTTNLNNTFNQIDRQDVGITLRLTPQINSNDYVTLRIFTDVSAVIPNADTTLGPTTTVRSSETTIIVKDSQMIAIGGLISDENSDSQAGVPFLKDIPLIGDLFGRSSEDRSRTNLLTFITPHIIRDQYDARDQTITKRDSLKDEIRIQNVNPTREEILNQEAVDKVAELNTNELPIPEPIVPTQEEIAAIRDQQRMKERPSASASALSDEPVEVDVNPALPELEQSRYIIAKIKAPESVKNALPFIVNKNGLLLIDTTDNTSNNFFMKGTQFKYLIGDVKVAVEKLASFDSEKEARDIFNDEDLNTYSLSSFEITNLGNGPWLSTR
jgi:general secretion pathway protein D